jgi:hypothetical protein
MREACPAETALPPERRARPEELDMKSLFACGFGLLSWGLLAASAMAEEPAAADPKPAVDAKPTIAPKTNPCLSQQHAWCCDSHNKCTVIGGVDLVYVKAYSSSGLGWNFADLNGFNFVVGAPPAPLGPTQEFDLPLDGDYEFTQRFWIGIQIADGLGVRARYWDFDQDNFGSATLPPTFVAAGLPANISIPVTSFHTFDTYVIDLEAIDTVQLGCHTAMTWSLGFRYVNYEELRGVNSNIDPTHVFIQKEFEGYGLTGSLELRRRVCHDIGIYGSARGSVLVGDEVNFVDVQIGAVVGVGRENEEENVKWMLELAGGVEWAKDCGFGTLSVRGGVEFQHWDGFGAARDSFGRDENIGFFGLTFSVGLIR